MDPLFYLLGSKTFLIIIIGLAMILYALAFMGQSQKGNMISHKKNEFFETLLEGLKSNTIQNTDDLVNIYKGLTYYVNEDIDYRFFLNVWLRDFLANLIAKKIDKNMSEQDLLKYKIIVSEFIKKNEEMSPYDFLPDTERSLITDIAAFIESNDKEALKRKINELAATIRTRHQDILKLEKNNKWSFNFAIIGLILTIFFGAISLVGVIKAKPENAETQLKGKKIEGNLTNKP